MIIATLSRHSKLVAGCLFLLFYTDLLYAGAGVNTSALPVTRVSANIPDLLSNIVSQPTIAGIPAENKAPVKTAPIKLTRPMTISVAKDKEDKEFIGGPGQPEMAAFQSANGNNMVDLFSGDFSYNIALCDVGGYPISLGYRAGVTMDQEASWVGLGWNINPGTITRNLRGLPDDFNGKSDSIRKSTSIRENKTVGVTGAVDLELTGVPIQIGASLGVFHNNYKGWGLETGINATINSGTGAKGPLSGGLSITNNSQEGLTIAPSLSLKFTQYDAEEKAGVTSSFSASLPYNSRSGLKGLQLSAGIQQSKTELKNQGEGKDPKRLDYSTSGGISSTISFASPTFTPSITMPMTSRQFSFTGKVGAESWVLHPNFSITGYVSKQRIDVKDTAISLPSYGYLYFQDGAKNRSSLLDFNREKELMYREKPPMPHIAVPMYTYDAFSITGEGTGGMFRAYRGDIGFIHDHFIRTKDESNRASIDVGFGNIVHGGVDLNINRAFTQNGPWLGDNTLKNIIDFKENKNAFEAVYFRNPGEKAINSKAFYQTLGDDDVVAVKLYQAGNSSSVIQATNYLTRYRNKRAVGNILLTPQNVVKPERDKRTQVISYLTAKEADAAALSKYIEDYTVNQFTLDNCNQTDIESVEGIGTGLPSEYFRVIDMKGTPDLRTDGTINYDWAKNAPYGGFPKDKFSIRRVGRVKAPVTGTYTFQTTSDDGIRVWLNDSLIINQWNDHGATNHSANVNLIANEMYKIRIEWYENKGKAVNKLSWAYPGQSMQIIPQQFLYPPARDKFVINNFLVKEKRINTFRRETHLSAINVLNTDGKRYLYEIPVYNLKQKEATFAVNYSRGNSQTGLVGYNNGTDNSANNRNGKDWYFNSEQTPAYAHSFLLTSILSEDYADLTGNGVSDDDLGDAVKFNYSKVAGVENPYRWRIPYIKDSVTLNEGLKTDTRDDKGNYVYGEKEMWYLHSIVSKTMIATFVLEDRNDLYAIDESGNKYVDNTAKRLKEIVLYNKVDFSKNGTNSRPIKTIRFEYTYELCQGVNKPLTDSGKLTLKKVWFISNGNEKGKQNPYVFNYRPNNPSYNIKSYDRWSTYKDPAQNPGYTASNKITNAEYPYALQDSALAAYNVSAWTLDSINLPSGGSMKVQFESDDYAYVQNRRAMQMFKVVGLGTSSTLGAATTKLYTSSGDHLYIFIKVPQPVSSVSEVYQKYLTEVKKIFFRLNVKMPSDNHGSGNEFISCYADLDASNGYGYADANTIWVRIKGISLKGDGDGSYSPLAKAAIQFLRLNLPSKAYPGSEAADNLDLTGAVKMIFAMADNIRNAFESFDKTARDNGWAADIDTSRTLVRLHNPNYKKLGGGHRVKKVIIYDKWDKMTGQRAAMYGREYIYTTQKMINNVKTTISSGVASYEPGLGGEENPFRQPIEYVDKVSALGPVTLGYSEEPLGESLFPSPGIGYSSVRVRSINYTNVKSANGYEESKFYTAYDFPTYVDHTVLDNDTKKRFKPALANFLRINARHYVSLSQGFKIELNDMHGKLRSQASYAATDDVNPVTFTENIYKVDNNSSDQKRLSSVVMAIKPDGSIDTTALIGKDIELMVDMREQLSITNGNNISLNTDMFAVPFIPPFFVIPAFLNLAQREENLFRSVATLKVIQRYGLLDSVIHIDKGSKISTKDILYDAETGDVVLTRTQNMYNDPVYTFQYPSHWAYDVMGLAYKNIDVILKHVSIRDGKIVATTLPAPDSTFFAGGDEILVAGKQQTGTQNPDCSLPISTFPSHMKIWAIDSSVSNGGAKSFYFVDKEGKPYNGFDITMKIIRSGRRNVNSNVGAVSSLVNPIVKNGVSQQYELVLNNNSKVINASALEFRQVWSVDNPVCSTKIKTCPPGYTPDPTRPDTCIKVNFTNPTITDSVNICLANYTNVNYSACGTYIYDTSHATCSRIDTSNHWWVNHQGITGGACNSPNGCLFGGGWARTGKPNAEDSVKVKDPGLPIPLFNTIGTPDSLLGPMNRAGIWPCQAQGATTYLPVNTWIGFTEDVYFPYTGMYYIGMGGDNQVRVTIDNVLFKHINFTDERSFELWNVYPRFMTAGIHHIRVEGYNSGNVAMYGVEIYANTETELRNARCYSGCANPLNVLFSTKDAINRVFYTYACPGGYTLNGTLCTQTLYAPSSDSTLPVKSNVYVSGFLGNWRGYRNYTYFGPRKELITDNTSIRHAGTFNDFAPFWSFASNRLTPQYDTTRWVWNSQQTMFNRKGMELENADPLGRFNSGIYGYGQTMPIAVTQNSKNNESVFEGFEDYDYSLFNCDTCSVLRHFDIGNFKSKIVSTQKHTGKFSIRANTGESLGFTVKLSPDSVPAIRKPIFTTVSNSCLGGQAGLQSVALDTNNRKQRFSPAQGRKMVLSVWVKEERDCHCMFYTGNRVTISFTGSAQTYQFTPTGNLLEGWQRYDAVFTIPATATHMNFNLESIGNSPVYFDDLRIHPFNANMKSFVYNPIDIRLMADLDENNFASFYEYDDDGTLIRVKKETERGIKTVRETRSAFLKD